MSLHEHFEALYAADDDPWDVRGTWYERRKRALLLASLGKPRYRSAFEPGCGNGEMSAALAQRCERLLACDGAASAVAAAQRRLQHLPDRPADAVRIEARSLPAEWPNAERFDLIVISELAYYFDAAALHGMLAQAAASLEQDGELLMCHYLHDFDDRVTATRDVHAIAGATPGLVRSLHHLDQDFLLEAWRKAAP
jgi:SAM-dependent methyltransferase